MVPDIVELRALTENVDFMYNENLSIDAKIIKVDPKKGPNLIDKKEKKKW
jgi:hypothetical protein